MKTGFTVEVVWWDADVIKYRCTGSNGSFSGATEVYMNHSDLSEMAEALSGFPLRADDVRDVELGQFDPSCAGGGVKLHFYCLDSVGHAAVEMRLRGDTCTALGDVESVALRIALEAAAIDRFADEIGKIDLSANTKAHLQMAGIA
ncbi:MAG TPA: hypothetical protein VKE93_12270 [Candidatus Angelobacter sp.]|nr:hypothetical protein [Candidatus Angelobacter sp.]